jgi:hypothetical protein
MSFDDPHGATNRRATDPVIEMIAHKLGRVEESVDKMADAVTKLAVIEERQVSDRQALERAFMAIQKTDERCSAMFEKCVEKLEKTDGRVDALESAAPTQALTSGWILEGVKALAIVAIMFALNKSGLL